MPTIGFNPRTPCGVRLCYHIYKYSVKAFQSTHSLRSATLQNYLMENSRTVSIHALLAECDFAGGWLSGSIYGFQSTHSLRSATTDKQSCCAYWRVSIHALLAECDLLGQTRRKGGMVSIHALLAECDCLHALMVASGKSFNPRTPCGVRLFGGDELQIVFAVSIHALLAECDKSITSTLAPSFCFNPRTPCGVRPFLSGWNW